MAQFSVIYSGFDGLDLSYRIKPLPSLLNELRQAKEKATEIRESYGTEIGGMTAKVNPSGSKGGYQYVLSTGPFGATWFFREDDEWGIKVSVSSGCLATRGFEGALQEV